MSWPHDPSRDLASHHIQRHSTKSIDRTYLLPCSYRLTFLIYQTSSIYCWESAFLHCIVEKRTIRHPTLLGLASPPPPFHPPYDYWAVSSTMAASHLEPSSDHTPGRNQKGLVTDCTACWTQQVRHCGKPTSRFMKRAYLRMNPVGWLIRSLWEKSEALG